RADLRNVLDRREPIQPSHQRILKRREDRERRQPRSEDIWFAHRDGAGVVGHVDVRGPSWKGSLTGGAKSLFRLPAYNAPLLRLQEHAAAGR
ncbi:MAG: DUF3991 domain-containing protein, partial [Hyphomicrobiales bacterium]|nr:DUF3991 domain-containing protein [Hyphomicrobiales bacterium]